ncbi:MAG: hypothetical protein GY851_19825 [bacterium]|nr:hypothetical protein [bacterium]
MDKKRFRAAAFVVVVVIAHLALRHLFLSEVLSATRPVERDWEFSSRTEGVSVGLLGNSHVALSLRSDAFPDSINLASLGESYMVTYYRLKHLFKEFQPPFRTMVIQLDLHSFCSAELGQTSEPYWAQYLDYLDIARRRGEPFKYFGDWIRCDAVPYAGNSRMVFEGLNRRIQGTQSIVKQRLGRDFSDVPDKRAQARIRAASHFKGTSWYDEIVAQYFADLLDLCQDQGVTVVLVEFPLTQAYTDEAALLMPTAEWDSRVVELLAGRDPIVLDYRDLFADRVELFSDPDHLNLEGSRVLSERLGKDLSDLDLLPQRN